MESMFTADTYETPPGRHGNVLVRMFAWTRAPFYTYVLKSVLSARAIALRGKYGDEALMASSEQFVRYIEACGGRFRITGLDTIRTVAGPVVVVGNHMSSLETFVLPSLIGRSKPMAFIVKESLTTHPLFGPIMRAGQPVTVARVNPRDDLKRVLTLGPQTLAQGRSLCVFPQSTRQVRFVPSRFNTLGVKLAERGGVPVIPVALRTDFWGNGKWLKDFGPVGACKDIRFAFGAPIAVTGRVRDAQREVVDFVVRHLTAWGVPCDSAA